MNNKHVSGKVYRLMRVQSNHRALYTQYDNYVLNLTSKGEIPLSYRQWLHIPNRGNY